MDNAQSVVELSWAQYVERVIAQDQRPLRNAKVSPLQVLPDSGRWSYLDELAACQRCFDQTASLIEMPPDDLKRVTGILAPSTERWFGLMLDIGVRFKSVVNRRSHELAQWLDSIPRSGPISASQVEQYLEGMIAMPGVTISTATRLLAMKRPDYAVPVTLSNVAGFRSDSRIGPRCPLPTILNKQDGEELRSLARQYAAMLQQLWKAPWWQAPPPDKGLEATIWSGRVALVDALFYDP